MMAYVFPIHHGNTRTLHVHNKYTLHLIGQCDAAMVTDSHFEYADYVVKFKKKMFKNSIF